MHSKLTRRGSVAYELGLDRLGVWRPLAVTSFFRSALKAETSKHAEKAEDETEAIRT